MNILFLGHSIVGFAVQVWHLHGIHSSLQLRILKLEMLGELQERLSPAVLSVPLGDPRGRAFYDSRPHQWETMLGT